MKYRRKPVLRDMVDALKGPQSYTVQRESGELEVVNIADFERDYEPVKRSTYAKRIKKPRAKKGGEQA